MMNFSDEELSAFMDGQAEPALATAIEAAAETDKDLEARLSGMRRNDELLRKAFDTELGTSKIALPPATIPTSKISPLRRRPEIAWWQMAAAVLMALLIGWGVGSGSKVNVGSSSVAIGAHGNLIAEADLARGLSAARSGVPLQTSQGTLNVVLSFRSNGGDYCRQFDLGSQNDGAAAVACTHDGSWLIRGWVDGRGKSAGEYRTASGPDDLGLGAIIDKIGVKESLDAAGEDAAIKSHWKSEVVR